MTMLCATAQGVYTPQSLQPEGSFTRGKVLGG